MSGRPSIGRVRQWLDGNLFLDAPPPSVSTGNGAAILGVLAVVAVVVQLVRIRASAPLNSIWEEDGFIFLTDALRWGFFHALATPYNGYLNTVSRLVAEPASKLPIGWFAPAMALSGAVITAICAVVVWTASAAHITNRYLRGTLAAIVVVVPVVGVEMMDDVTYSIWFMLFASYWALLWRPRSAPGAWSAGALLLLTALSNALALFLLPIWLLRVVAVRDRRDKIIVASLAVGLLVQFASSWTQRDLLGEQGNTQIAPPSTWHWSLVPAYLQRVVGGALTGQRITGYLWIRLGTPLLVVLAAGLLLLVVWACMGSASGTRALVVITLATSVAMFLESGYQRQIGAQFFWPHGTSNVIGSHYVVTPVLLVLSALVVLVDAVGRRGAAAYRQLSAALMALVVLSVVTSFKVADASARGDPSWTTVVAAGRVQCLQTTLEAVSVGVSPRSDYDPLMQVPCSKLIGAALAAGRQPLAPDPHTALFEPKDGATLSGVTPLLAVVTDTVPTTSVEFRLAGGDGRSRLVGSGQLTVDGWFRAWNTRTTPNGTYQMTSVVTDSAGKSSRSKAVTVVISNPTVHRAGP